MAALASLSSRILWQGDFVLANLTVFILFSPGNFVSTHLTAVSILFPLQATFAPPFRVKTSFNPFPVSVWLARATTGGMGWFYWSWMFWWHQKAWLINLIVLMTSKSLIDQFDSFDDIKKFFNLDNQVELPLHPPSYQDSSGLPNYQDTFQVNMIETPWSNIWCGLWPF